MEEEINKFDNLTKKFIDKHLANMLKPYTQGALNKNVNQSCDSSFIGTVGTNKIIKQGEQ